MIIIPLGNDTRAEVILSVLGQLSDGIWENSNGMGKYWEYADVEGTDLQVDDDSWRSGFRGKTEADVRNWFANKAKQVVKIWAEDYGKDPNTVWKRDNHDEVAYMGHHRLPIKVRDVYECYDFLKQRKGNYDYGYRKPEPEVVSEPEPTAPVTEGGMNPSQQELEDFFLDASTHIKSSKSGTKYPSGYVKADTEATGADYYADRIADGISWALDVSVQTALDLIHAMQLDEDDLEGMGFTREEYPELFEG